MRQGPCMWFFFFSLLFPSINDRGLEGKPFPPAITGSSALCSHLFLLSHLFLISISSLFWTCFYVIEFDALTYRKNHANWKSLSCHKFKTERHFLLIYPWQSGQFLYQGLWGDLWSSPRTLRSQTPGQLFKMSPVLKNDPRLEGADGAFSPHEASAQLRSPPFIEHLSAAAGLAVESELLWSQFPTNSCSRAKQSIDPVCHFHTLVSGGWWWSLMCSCHVCGVKGWPGHRMMSHNCSLHVHVTTLDCIYVCCLYVMDKTDL